MARTSKIWRDKHQAEIVGEGAVKQEGVLDLYRCNACGSEVVWATSIRTGRKYLVNVTYGYMGQRFYVKRNIHKCEMDTRG